MYIYYALEEKKKKKKLHVFQSGTLVLSNVWQPFNHLLSCICIVYVCLYVCVWAGGICTINLEHVEVVYKCGD